MRVPHTTQARASFPGAAINELYIVVHPVNMGGTITSQTCIVSGNQTIKATRIYHRRRRDSDARDAERGKRRRQRFKDPEKPQSRQLRGSKKGCKLNPHHTT